MDGAYTSASEALNQNVSVTEKANAPIRAPPYMPILSIEDISSAAPRNSLTSLTIIRYRSITVRADARALMKLILKAT